MSRLVGAILLVCCAALPAGCGLATMPGSVQSPKALNELPSGLKDINLYVADRGSKATSKGALTIYGLARGKLLQTIVTGVDRPSAIGYDAVANLIAVVNAEPSSGRHSGSVALYAPGAHSPTNVLKGTSDPVSLAFDGSGKIYIADYLGGVGVYEPKASRPVLVIPGPGHGILYHPRLVAVDSAGNVYVANGPVTLDSAEQEVNALAVFLPGKTHPKYIERLHGTPRAMIVRNDRLYVATAFPKHSKQNPYGSIYIYQLGGYPKLLRQITQGLYTPDALAIDAENDLYVANLNGNDIGVYRHGESEPGRIISNGIHAPRALTIGPNGDLYVSNLYVNTVTAYKPGHSDPRFTITSGIDAPAAITLNAPSPP